MPGYALTAGGSYPISVTTAVRADGTHDWYLHSVGAATHQHLWWRPEAVGTGSGGAQLKGAGSHLGPTSLFTAPPEGPFARASLRVSNRDVMCQIANPLPASVFSAEETVARYGGGKRRHPVEIPFEQGTSSSYVFELVDTRVSSARSKWDNLLEFGPESPIAIGIRRVCPASGS